MNKVELINSIAQKTKLSKKDVEAALETMLEIITDTLKAGGEVTLTSFGTFSAKYRATRKGVNPQNPNQSMQIPAVTVPKFKAGLGLKRALKENVVDSETSSTSNVQKPRTETSETEE